ncbi:hypothetical protein HMPREF3105_02195 [Micrococcus sp. HMSC31B01]|uniref:hypothetical protein n=1 Tax=Micrococcus TaxID=1269 RepID=UPI0008A1569C|nr:MULTISPECIES: hypothetical protein [Micrococcus]AYO50846.1 hypothetical protein FMM_11030 [Micrococcus luteus]OFS15137.1 hypothetical protein HMPREF3105_02195 [Micrococcus sp. HMSC31B01]
MSTRRAYTEDDVARFMDLARGGRDRHRPTTGTRELTDRRPIPRDWPAMTNADGSPSAPLPTADPEKE